MAVGYRRQATPAEVERRLRQEAGLGCANCGHPYIEYHHIVPCAEEAHFRPEDMVALCGNCHASVAKQVGDRQYEIKGRPYDIRRGIFRGALEYDERDLVFKIGGCWYESVPVILKYCAEPIISCSLSDGQAKVSLNLFDKLGKRVLAVEENNVVFRVNDLWDFTYKHNLAVARYAQGNIAVRMDFRKPDAIIDGKLWLGSTIAELGPTATNIAQVGRYSGARFSDCDIGIHVGDPSQ